MQNVAKYVIFQTKWGYFGLAGTESALYRSRLPEPKPEKIKPLLLKNLPAAHFDKTFFKTLQEQIIAYFEGDCVNFGPEIPIALDEFSAFYRAVLTACRAIKFGQTISYAGLAKRLARPNASRAVGNALAKNPLPLIIPCHRVIRSPCLRRGKLVPAQAWIGGFSAPGGVKLKKKMLELEHQAPRA